MDMVKTTENGFYHVCHDSEQTGNDAGGYVISVETVSVQEDWGAWCEAVALGILAEGDEETDPGMYKVESPYETLYSQHASDAYQTFRSMVRFYYEDWGALASDDEYGFTGTGTGLSDLC